MCKWFDIDNKFRGFSLYGQAILGQTPCASQLPITLSTPAAISQNIQSLSSYIAATATASTPTVSVKVIVDQVFALSLPLKQGKEQLPQMGMSATTKIGIGVGAGVGVILALLLCAWLIWLKHRRRPEETTTSTDTNSNNQPMRADYNKSNEPKVSTPNITAVEEWKPATSPVHIPWQPNPNHSRNTSELSGSTLPGWQQQQYQQQPYIRQPPPRFSENFTGMLVAPTASPPLPQYSPPPPERYYGEQGRYVNELSGRENEVYEAGSGIITPAPRRQW